MRFCIAKRKIYTNGPKISFRGKFFYSRIGHSGHGVLGFWIFRKDMIFPYGNISGNVGEEFLRRKKNAGFGFREVEITCYLLSEFFWVQHINLDVDLLKKNNVIQRIFYCSLCDRSMAFHVDWGPLSQFDVRRRSVVGFHYSSHSG